MRLKVALHTISSTLKCESVYITGSYARGDQTVQSDVDVLLLVRLPVLLSSIRKLSAFFKLKQYRVDMNIISTYSLHGVMKGHSSPIIPSLVNWRNDAVLVSGKDLLPMPNASIDSRSFAVFACRITRWVLGYIQSEPSGIRLSEEAVRWLNKQGKNMIENCKIKGVPSSWRLLGERLIEETSKHNPNLKLICGWFAEMLESIRKDLRFSLLDQDLYVLNVFAGSRKLLWRTLFKKAPVQLRFFDAMTILFKGASMEKPDPLLIHKSLELIDDHVIPIDSENPYVIWHRARKVLIQYFETALRLPFGNIVINKGPEYPRIIFV